MYWYIGKFIKLITYTFRVFQFLGIIYFILYVIFWFCAVAQIQFASILAPIFYMPYEITLDILNKTGIHIDKDFRLFCPEIFLSMILTFLVLIIYNFIFIPLGGIEKFFIEKSYDKGEKDYDKQTTKR